MRVLIIGTGFVGLAAALKLAQAGHDVQVLEKEEKPGGLAIGFKQKNWKWPLEKHYHHLFTSDWAIRNLASQVKHDIIFRRPKTSVFVDSNIYQLDSPTSLLAFPHLSAVDKVRTASVLSLLRMLPWQLARRLESVSAASFLKQTMGQAAWQLLWEPLFSAKFGRYASKIPASWFWARIKKRSAQLGYPKGGFESLAQSVKREAEKHGTKFHFGTGVTSIKRQKNGLLVIVNSGNRYVVDCVTCTLPTPLFCKVTTGLPRDYVKKLTSLDGLGAVNLVLCLNKQFLEDGTYWLNINERGFPFLAIVEHTNFMDKKYYGGEHIVYVGNYLEKTHPYFDKDANQLLEEFTPYLKKINPRFSASWVGHSFVSKAPFAQPIIPLNYSKKIPPLTTPIPSLYLANIQQVYPWDRGTNYAVELGEKVAKLILFRWSKSSKTTL